MEFSESKGLVRGFALNAGAKHGKRCLRDASFLFPPCILALPYFILKTGQAKAIRFSTLNAICKALNCQPGDLLEYVEDEE
ncbi:hypothetical protein FKZ59_13455 [Ureibacillus terrenus]|uniref:HTH cro/C1-type domain-containing protein n=1 Tax=Ureibacillus terrenus TaxID=118246 RepID=A0A540UXD4_9BACL|nr:hypothetical protein FKZ59_13455 [Ureibacillus terrenus]